MPVNRKIYNNLVKQYGEEKGRNVYYAMERQGRIPEVVVRPHPRRGTKGVKSHRRRL